jgi:hypothetical protein
MMIIAANHEQADALTALIANEKMVILLSPDAASMVLLGQMIKERLTPDFKYIASDDGVFMCQPSRCKLNGEGYGILVITLGLDIFCWVNQVPWTEPILIDIYKEVLQEELAKMMATGGSPHAH